MTPYRVFRFILNCYIALLPVLIIFYSEYSSLADFFTIEGMTSKVENFANEQNNSHEAYKHWEETRPRDPERKFTGYGLVFFFLVVFTLYL